jgi:cystathionine gamma-synthase
MRVGRLREIADFARREGLLSVIDNTFATPVNFRPLQAGFDLCLHSATKYLGGHSDLMAGAVVARDPGLSEQIVMNRTLYGATLGILEAFLVTRGMRTLYLRMEAASRNAIFLAERLAEHPAVARVRYPGLPDDPEHALAASFMDSFGAMVSFELAGGVAAADRACQSVRLIRRATSLGGVESTLERRGALPGQEHVPGSLIRLSTGCEDPHDLWADLDAALNAAAAS